MLSSICLAVAAGPAAASGVACELTIDRVDPSGGFFHLLRLKDPTLQSVIAQALASLPEAQALPPRYYVGYQGLYVTFRGDDCVNAGLWLWLYRGFIEVHEPGLPTRILEDTASLEQRVYEFAADHRRWTLGRDPSVHYTREEDACGLIVTAFRYSGLRNPSVTITSKQEIEALAEYLRDLESAQADGEARFGGIELTSISSCTPFPRRARIHGDTILVKDASGAEEFLRDAKGLREVVLDRFPELRAAPR